MADAPLTITYVRTRPSLRHLERVDGPAEEVRKLMIFDTGNWIAYFFHGEIAREYARGSLTSGFKATRLNIIDEFFVFRWVHMSALDDALAAAEISIPSTVNRIDTMEIILKKTD